MVREVGSYLGINVRLNGVPETEIPVPDLTQPTNKVIRKIADSLQLPLLDVPAEFTASSANSLPEEAFPTLTVTPHGLIVGAPSELLEQQLKSRQTRIP